MAQKQGTTKDTEVCAWAHQMHTPVTMHVGSSASALSRWAEHRAPHFPLLCGHRWHPFSPTGLLTHLPQITSRIQHWALQRINTSPCPEHQPLSWWPPGQGLFTMTPQSWEAPLWGGEAAGQSGELSSAAKLSCVIFSNCSAFLTHRFIIYKRKGWTSWPLSYEPGLWSSFLPSVHIDDSWTRAGWLKIPQRYSRAMLFRAAIGHLQLRHTSSGTSPDFRGFLPPTCKMQ